MEYYQISDGSLLPKIGFGTYDVKGTDGRAAIRYALDAGYRLFDTASLYETEYDLGLALKESNIPREEYQIETKLWIDEMDDPRKALENSLRRLGTEYVDIYMIHWPRQTGAYDENWKSQDLKTYQILESLVKSGKVKHIGLSNFLPHHLQNILECCSIKPVVDQLELHAGYHQEFAIRYCHEHSIVPMAWCPLGHGCAVVQDSDFRRQLADKYGRSVQQIDLRFLLQKGILPIPKASSPEHISANLKVFDFCLTDEEISMMSCIPQTSWLGEHPDFMIPEVKSNPEQI